MALEEVNDSCSERDGDAVDDDTIDEDDSAETLRGKQHRRDLRDHDGV